MPYTLMTRSTIMRHTSADVRCSVTGSATTRCENRHMKFSSPLYPSDCNPAAHSSIAQTWHGPSPCWASEARPAEW